MKLRSLSGIALAAIALLASCRPYDEQAHQRKVTRKPPATAEQLAKAQEEEARKKAEEELKKQQAAQTAGLTQPGGVTTTPPTPGAGTTAGTTAPGGTNPTPPAPPTPPVEKRPDYPVAKKVLGREGFVYSPYNNKIISVRDEQDRLLPSGTLVADPTFDESEKKYFRVP